MMGHCIWWCIPFVLNLVSVALLFILLLVYFGQINLEQRPTPLCQVWRSLKNHRVGFAHITTFFFLAGHFSLYGYLTPFVRSEMGFSGGLLTAVYFIYGLAAVTGGGFAGFFCESLTSQRTLFMPAW